MSDIDKYTIDKVAKILGISVRTLDRWNKSGKFKCKIDEFSKIRYYTIDDIQKAQTYIKESKNLRGVKIN